MLVAIAAEEHHAHFPEAGHRSDGGQTRADFFKSLHESAKSAVAVGELFADFLQTFFMTCTLFQTFADFFDEPS